MAASGGHDALWEGGCVNTISSLDILVPNPEAIISHLYKHPGPIRKR